ncbi:hypothetical protein [Cryobacterium sp. SO1]|uniref:hypothetical protein n=1 Tax=Cryobacterium sp. SO1 TaxID=1897061 RepID=UPI0010231E54|nr:hypothetical protein [Cryobacterium sp. SO1]
MPKGIGDQISFSDNETNTSGRQRPEGLGEVSRGIVAPVVLFIVDVFVGSLLSVVLLFMQMGVAACSDLSVQCDYQLLYATLWITPIATLATAAGTITVLILQRRQRTAATWLVPALGLMAIVIAFIVAGTLLGVAIPV